MKLKLIVIKTENIHKTVEFYKMLNLSFDYHKHNNSPYHYTTTIDKTILEIYPLPKNKEYINNNLRLGFQIKNFNKTIKKLKENNINFLLKPQKTEFGYLAIVKDYDNNKIELYK